MIKSGSEIQLYAFDIDGTTISEQGLEQSTIEAFNNLHERQYYTTVITARPRYAVMNALEGKLFSTLVSSNIPFSIETGTRVVNYNGDLLIDHPLIQYEVDRIVEILSLRDSIEYISFIGDDDLDMTIGWFPSHSDKTARENFLLDNGGLVNLLDSEQVPITELSKFLQSLRCSKVSIVFKRTSGVDTSDELSMATILMGLNFTRESKRRVAITSRGISKLTGLEDIAKILGVDLSKILFAGNDINDFPIIKDARVGIRIVVGSNERIECALKREMLQEIVERIISPAHLGLYLLKLNGLID